MIEVNNLSKNFKIAKKEHGFINTIKHFFVRKYIVKRALDDVSFTINDGEIVAYLGPNGAGKSTTIKIMCGVLAPTSGGCIINGINPQKDRKKHVKNIGVVFGQRSQLWWDVPVIDSFYLLKEIYKIPDDEFKENLENLTKKLSLEDIINSPLRQLSLGQKMRCELAGSLLHSPKVLFLDEPTVGLDAKSKLAVRDFIKEINKERKTTIILTTHDMNDIEALTNKIIIIGKGKLLYNGTFDDIKNKYKRFKTLKIQFEEDYGDVELENCTLVEKVGEVYTYKNDDENFKLTKFLQELEKKFKVVDVQVLPMDLEHIITNLYEELGI